MEMHEFANSPSTCFETWERRAREGRAGEERGGGRRERYEGAVRGSGSRERSGRVRLLSHLVGEGEAATAFEVALKLRAWRGRTAIQFPSYT